MKGLFLFLLVSLQLAGNAQGLSSFQVELQEVMIPNMPALQSYAWAKATDGKWLLVCGRNDGLHDHRPPFSFPSTRENDAVWVVDPNTNQVWSAGITGLSNGLQNALRATNTQFQQVGDMLYVTGGYGVDVNTNGHKTFNTVTAISVNGLVNAVVNGQSIQPYFKQTTDNRLQVTGGYMHYFNDEFVLVGGQVFTGRYNPHNGPSFTQSYTESVKRFELDTSANGVVISNYSETVDALNLHRRDYNLAPHVFANGDTGAIAYTGVFQPTIDVPYFNVVDVTSNGYSVRPGFNQLLNQYHTAHLSAFDQANNRMHTVFFGGMGMYVPDGNGGLISDSLVPFVKTISMVTRFANDSMVEYNLPIQMPGYLGASAEFIPSDSVFEKDGIIDLNNANGRVLAGYVVGGIESTAPNIFMFASSGTSNSTPRVFKVYLKPGTFGLQEAATGLNFKYELFPNPVRTQSTLTIHNAQVACSLYDAFGSLIKRFSLDARDTVLREKLDFTELSAGAYFLQLRGNGKQEIIQIIKQ